MVSKEEIPDHWEIKKMQEVCEITYGDGLPKRDRNGGDIPVYGSGGVSGHHDEALHEGPAVILGRKGTIDEVRWEENPFWAIDTTFYTQIDESKVSPRYIYYFFSSLDLSQYDTSSAVPSLRKGDLKKIEIPVPPLDEQKVIVDKLDNIFESIGEIQDAQEQVEKIYQDVVFSFFTSRVRDAETDTVETDELIESTQYGSSNATNSEGDGYPSLRMGNYNLRGEMDYSKIKYQDLEDDDFEKYRVEKGDVLFNRTNSKDLVGKMCVYDGGLEDAVFASYLIRVKLNEDRVLPEYFVTYMNSHLGEVERQGKLKQAVSQANINATELREMEMAIPSLERQKGIVKNLNYMRSKVDDIKAEVDKKGKLIEDMPDSILAEAFKGNLVDFGAMSESDELGSTEQGIGEKQESSFDGEGQQSLGEYR